MHTNFKLLIKFPSRSRPLKFFKALDEYIKFANNTNNLAFLVTLDSDDSSMNNSEVISKLEEYKTKVKLVYFFGNSKTKIEAVNADVNKVSGWDILLLASDDMLPIKQGYDDIIKNDMNEFFKDRDGVLWYNDGGQNRINTLCILGKKYYDRFGYIYHPEYVSLWCDNEFTDVSIQLNRVYRSETILIEHQHPAWQKADHDVLYARNDMYMDIDRQTYMRRHGRNFDLDLNLPLLSILTPSVPERIDTHLKKLIEKINLQIGSKNVEHLVLIDNKKRSIGLKRESLVQSATGKYVAFVDDDDDISNDYVDSLLEGIRHNPDVVTFKQYCYINDNPVSIINFSLNNKENEGYVAGTTVNRQPFHVCAWRSSIAKKYSFTDKNYSEDWYWAQQLIKASKTEYHIDKAIHSYVYDDRVTTTPIYKQT